MFLQASPNQWESDFFGKPIERVEIVTLETTEGNHASAPPPKHGALQQIKLACHELAPIAFVQQQGFQLVEGEVDFCLSLTAYSEPATLTCATTSDIPSLQTLFGSAFPNSRFRAPYFSDEDSQRFYAEWIRKAVLGQFDDICLIQRTTNGELQGAVSLRVNSKTARIGLLAVEENARGQGIGTHLMQQAISWAQQQGAEKLFVATQHSNLNAIHLYQNLGARICAMNYWFYRIA